MSTMCFNTRLLTPLLTMLSMFCACTKRFFAGAGAVGQPEASLIMLIALNLSVVPGSGVHCYFCTSGALKRSENCAFLTQCPTGSPGCVTVHVSGTWEKLVMKGCSFEEKCNKTVASYRISKHWTVTGCEFCDEELCNSCCRTSILHIVVFTLPLIVMRILV